MKFIQDILLNPKISLLRYCAFAVPICLIPSVTLMGIAIGVFTLLGVDTESISRKAPQPTFSEFFGMVIVAPVIETVLLGWGIYLLSRMTSNVVFVVTTSAIIWASLHATLGFLWFFGVVWSFFIFSCAFVAWRKISYKHAFFAASIPHALVNFLATLTLFLD
jgi:hypothetical protein